MQGTITKPPGTRKLQGDRGSGAIIIILSREEAAQRPLSVWIGPESNGGAWTRLFSLVSLSLDAHISTWKDAAVWNPASRQERWVGGAGEPLVRQVVQGTSLGDIMELCRMDDVTLPISGEGEEKGRKVGLTRCVVYAASLPPLMVCRPICACGGVSLCPRGVQSTMTSHRLLQR